jgi:hypothetical protein
LDQSRKLTFVPHPKPITPALQAPPLKVQKLTWVEMVEFQLKGLCYNCDDKYFPRNKCKEQKLFMVISKDVSNEEFEVSPKEELPKTDDPTLPSNPPKFEPLISLNALTGFSAPQNLKLIGYSKHGKVIILVDSGSTHNFIHRHLD